jgi:hypothetical protein
VGLRHLQLARAAAAGTVLLAVLTACGRDQPTAAAPGVQVTVGDQTVQLDPTQYCLAGTGKRYDTVPPIIEVSPDTPITFTVPAAVAQQGWSVQVFDQQLEEELGAVPVDDGATVFAGINTSDVVPPGFYLIVVEDRGSACGGLSGAWPVGFIRAADDTGTTPSGTASATPAPSG